MAPLGIAAPPLGPDSQRDIRPFVDRRHQMRLDLLAEGLYVRRRCMRVVALLVFPDLDDGELVRRRAALENFIANHAGILAAGRRELAQQRCIGARGTPASRPDR